MKRIIPILLVLLAVPFVLAQGAEPVAPLDIAAWFASTAALAGVVVAAVAFLRAHVLKTLQGVAVVILSLVVGGLLGIVGSLLGYVEGGMIAAIGYGLSAGLLASGGWDAIGTLLSKRVAAPSEG